LNNVLWTRAALVHLSTIKAYLDPFNPHAASKVSASPEALGNSLGAFPHRGRAIRGTAMREVVSVYPYTIRYMIDGTTVVILRVRHTSRRPTRP
jgi:plasmid stabilization system protein ParE